MSGSKAIQAINLNTSKPIALEAAQDYRLSAYRRLALQLHHELNQDNSSKSVMVVSPDDAGTCAVLAANLACCMAEELGREVLLADATREGRLSAALVDAIPQGLNTFLSHPSASLEDLLLPTSFPDVTFLPCGTRSKGYTPDNNPAFLEAAAKRFDFVIVAAGAILDDPFALASASAFGRVVLLVVENETPMKKFDEASYSLKMCGAEQIRVALVERTMAV